MRTVWAPLRAAAGAGVGALAVSRSWEASGLEARPWAVVGAIGAMAIVAVLLPRLQTSLVRPGAVPTLIGVMLFAVYCCVPETDQIPQVASLVVVLVAVEVAARRSLAWWVILPVIGLVMWSGLFGATGRDSALVGALFAIWSLVLPALARSDRAWPAAAIASVAVVAVARTGALQPTVGPAIVAVAVAAAASVVAVSVMGAVAVSRRS